LFAYYSFLKKENERGKESLGADENGGGLLEKGNNRFVSSFAVAAVVAVAIAVVSYRYSS